MTWQVTAYGRQSYAAPSTHSPTVRAGKAEQSIFRMTAVTDRKERRMFAHRHQRAELLAKQIRAEQLVHVRIQRPRAAPVIQWTSCAIGATCALPCCDVMHTNTQSIGIRSQAGTHFGLRFCADAKDFFREFILGVDEWDDCRMHRKAKCHLPRCVLHMPFCTWAVARCLSYVACGMRIGACRTLEVAYHMLHCWMLHARVC